MYQIDLINQANALMVFFDEIMLGRELYPSLNEAIAKYHLRGKEKEKAMHIASEVDKAVKIIDHFKQKYHLDERSESHRKDLFRLFMDYEEMPKDSFSVKPFRFAMGFYMRAKHFDETTLGDTLGSWSFGDTLDKNLDAALNEKEYIGLALLAFRVNTARNKPTTPKERLLKGIFGVNTVEESTEGHELKHIIDRFILDFPILLPEMSANLYDRQCSKNSDVIAAYERWNFAKDSLDETGDLVISYGEHPLLDRQVERKKSEYMKRRSELRYTQEFDYELFLELKARGIGFRTQSFILPLVRPSKLEDTLQEIKEALPKLKQYR